MNSKISTIENKNKNKYTPTWHVLCLYLIGMIVVQQRNDASVGTVHTPLDYADAIQAASASDAAFISIHKQRYEFNRSMIH